MEIDRELKSLEECQNPVFLLCRPLNLTYRNELEPRKIQRFDYSLFTKIDGRGPEGRSTHL